MAPSSSFASTNRYRTQSDKSISINVLKTDSGWRVEALTPRKMSGRDRAVLISWFASYREQVRKKHSLWLTRFYSDDQGYYLDIRAINNPRELAEKGQDIKSI